MNKEQYKQMLASVGKSDEVDAQTIADLKANFENVLASEVGKVEKAKASAIADEIKAASEKYAADLKAEKQAKIEAEEAKAEIAKKFEDLETAKAEVSKELDEVKSKLEAEAKERVYNERMSALSETYDLENETEIRKIVVAEIKDLDDAAYEAWNNKFAVLAADKTKAAKAEVAKKLEEAEKAKASADETDEEKESRESKEAEKAIAAAKAEAKEGVTNSKHEEVSLEDRFKEFKLELEETK